MIQPTTAGSDMAEKPFAKLKGDERRWRIEDAASTLKNYAAIKKDKELIKAARAELKREIEESKKAIQL